MGLAVHLHQSRRLQNLLQSLLPFLHRRVVHLENEDHHAGWEGRHQVLPGRSVRQEVLWTEWVSLVTSLGEAIIGYEVIE